MRLPKVLLQLIIVNIWLTLPFVVTDAAQERELLVQTGHSDHITSIAFSVDGHTTATGSSDGTIKLWDVSSGTQLRTIVVGSLIRSISFSPDGTFLACGSDDDVIRFWNIAGGTLLRTLPRNANYINSMAFSPDGRLLAGGGEDGMIKLWDVGSGTLLKAFLGQSPTVNSVRFSPDGETLASSGMNDELIKLWDVSSATLLRAFRGHASGVLAIAFSPDGKTLASGGWGGDANLWNVATGDLLTALQGHSDSVSAVGFSPDGNVVISIDSDITIKLWDATSGKILKSPTGDREYAYSVAVSPDGKIVATGGGEKSIQLWDAASRTRLKTLQGHSFGIETAIFSPDGKMLASVDNYDKTIKLWDMASGTGQRTLVGHSDDVLSVAFSPDSKTLASGSSDTTIKLWDVSSGTQLKTLSTGSIVESVAFGPDGKVLVSGGWGNIIQLWNWRSGRLMSTLSGHSDWVLSVAFSPDGRTLASGSVDKTIMLWDVAKHRHLRTMSGHSERVSSVAFCPDGKSLTSGSWDKTVKLWDVATGTTIETLDGGAITTRQEIAKSCPGLLQGYYNVSGSDRLVSETKDKVEIKLSDKLSGRELGTLVNFAASGWIVTSPAGFFDGTSGAWKKLIWRFNNNSFDYAPIETYFNEFFYPNLLQEVVSGRSPKPKAGQELERIDRRQPSITIASVGELIQGQQAEISGKPPSTDKRATSVTVEVVDNSDPAKQPDHSETSGARDLRLFRNGSLVKMWHGDLFEKAAGCEPVEIKPNQPRRVQCRTEVTLMTGENDLTAYAFNSSNIKSNDDAVSIESKAAKRDGTLYVLEIGVDKYVASDKQAGGRDYDLNFAVADIDAIGKKLTEQQHAIVQKQYAVTRIVSLRNENATKENILLGLKMFAKDGEKALIPANADRSLRDELAKIKPTGPEDALVIYYAGHGTARCVTDEKSKQTNCDRFYLIPTDGFPTGTFDDDHSRQASLYANSISDEELSTALETVDAGKMTMVIDACNSGAIEGQETRRGPMNSRGLAQLAYEKGMDVLTASQSLQSAQEGLKIKDKRGNIVVMEHGLLTYALLQAFTDRTANRDGDDKLTVGEWFTYAAAQVPQLQLEAMRYRSVENRGARDGNTKRAELVFVNGDDRNLPPEKRRLQTPRLFMRREADPVPFVVGKP